MKLMKTKSSFILSWNIVLNYYKFKKIKLKKYICLKLNKKGSGGELFEKIIDKGCFSEIEAASVLKKILSAVLYLHERGIVHRDLKPENFLYSSKKDDAEIKIIDFGLSRQFDLDNSDEVN